MGKRVAARSCSPGHLATVTDGGAEFSVTMLFKLFSHSGISKFCT